MVAAAAPSQGGWLPVPAADATPQPRLPAPALQPGQSHTENLGLGELSSSQRQDNPQNTGTGRAGLEVRAQPGTGTGWVAFASLRETHHCSGNSARPVIFPSHLQLDQFSFML